MLDELENRTRLIIRAHYADIRRHPVYIKAILDGATHSSAVSAARSATSATILFMANGGNVIEGRSVQERFDHEVMGEINPANSTDKTIAINMGLYSPAPFECCYLSPRMSTEEMSEIYHHIMTENHREGRYSDFPSEIAEEGDIEYALRIDRLNYRRLMAAYRPLWTNRKFGDEFGDAILHNKMLTNNMTFTTFGKALPIKDKGDLFHADANFVNEYSDAYSGGLT